MINIKSLIYSTILFFQALIFIGCDDGGSRNNIPMMAEEKAADEIIKLHLTNNHSSGTMLMLDGDSSDSIIVENDNSKDLIKVLLKDEGSWDEFFENVNELLYISNGKHTWEKYVNERRVSNEIQRMFINTCSNYDALHLSIIFKDFPMFKEIVDNAAPEDLNVKDRRYGNTALHIAAIMDLEQYYIILLKSGAKADIKNSYSAIPADLNGSFSDISDKGVEE